MSLSDPEDIRQRPRPQVNQKHVEGAAVWALHDGSIAGEWKLNETVPMPASDINEPSTQGTSLWQAGRGGGALQPCLAAVWAEEQPRGPKM